jgi:DNA mismatch repair protein MutL
MPSPGANFSAVRIESQTPPRGGEMEKPFVANSAAIVSEPQPVAEPPRQENLFRPSAPEPAPAVGIEEAAIPSESGNGYQDQSATQDASLIRRLKLAPAPPVAIAQIELTYILTEAPGLGLLLIDQHAAHEKILYLKFAGRKESREVQPLLVPHQYDAAPGEIGALEALAPALRENGFEIEPFGGNSFLIQSVPLIFDGMHVGAFIRDLLDDVGRSDLGREIAALRHKIGARAACRAAVMAGDRLSREEMQRLVEEVLETEEALRCPHGRPTMALLSKEQLDRQFGRI